MIRCSQGLKRAEAAARTAARVRLPLRPTRRGTPTGTRPRKTRYSSREALTRVPAAEEEEEEEKLAEPLEASAKQHSLAS